MTARRRTAQVLYWGAGWLSRIRTPQRMYEWDGPGTDFIYAGHRRRIPCRLSLWLLGVVQHLDWDHFDHWAVDHDGHDPQLCPECGACACAERPPEVFTSLG